VLYVQSLIEGKGRASRRDERLIALAISGREYLHGDLKGEFLKN
jgi:hypothetical protein